MSQRTAAMDGRRSAISRLLAGVAMLSKSGMSVAQGSGARTPAEIEALHRKSVAHLSVTSTMRNGDRVPTTGTGFVVTKAGHVLTAAHLVAGEHVEVAALGGLGGRQARFVPLSLVNLHLPIDVALFQFRGNPEQYSPLPMRQQTEPRVGERLIGLAFPPGVDSATNVGFRSSEGSTMGGWLTDMPLRPGDSGAPVFDEFGQVVAYVSRGSEREAKYAFVRPILPALAWLKDNVDANALASSDPLRVHISSIKPLDGHRLVNGGFSFPIVPSPFPGGARIELTLSHGRLGAASLVVNEMKLRVRRFAPGRDSRYAYVVDGGQVHGQGFIEPDVFRVRLRGGRVSSAGWVEKSLSFVEAQQGDLLRTEPPRRVRLSPTDDVHSFQGTVLVGDTGYYEFAIEIRYIYEAREYVYESAPIEVYGD